MSREPHEPTPGAGLRHAMGLAVSIMLPLAYVGSASGAAGIDGFPLWPVVGLTLLTTVVAALVSVAFPLPKAPALLARMAVVALVALGVRLTVPSPSVAWAEVRSDDGRLFSATAVLVLVLLALAYIVGHTFANLVAHLATGARTTDIAHQNARTSMVVWWWCMAFIVFVAGVMPAARDLASSVLIVSAAVVSLALLADLQVRTPPPPGTRPPIFAAPRRVRLAAAAFGGLAIVALTALVTPLVPAESLRTLPSIGWLEWEPGGRSTPSELIDTVTGGSVGDTQEQPDEPAGLADREWRFPTIPWPVWAVLATVLLTVILRPHRWRMGLRRLWTIVRRSRWLGGGDGAAGGSGDLEEWDATDDDRRGPGRLQRTLDRFRPRPREPRAAVLFDYFHVERLLASQEQGRARHETPHEHAVRIHVSAAHEELADLAADARFARRPPEPTAVDRSRELRRDIEQALRAKQPG